MKNIAFRVAAAAVLVSAASSASAEDIIADEVEETEAKTQEHKWLSFHAFADVETAYICRGTIYDTRPFSAQYASVEADLDRFGVIEPSIWTYSAMSSSGQSAELTHYAYAEVDYLLRYYYDIDLAEGWRLRNGVGKQWVTNPGFRGGHTVVDWQALQVLQTPWLSPYWRLRIIRRPFQETYWVLGLKRSFDILDDLALTVDFFGDLGDRRHMHNLYGGWADANGRRLHGGLQALNLVLRIDYKLFDHVSLFGFVGQFCVIGDEARDAVKDTPGPEMRRDLTFGGVGVALDF